MNRAQTGVRRRRPLRAAPAGALLAAGALFLVLAVVGPAGGAGASGALPCVARAGQVRVAVVIDFGTVAGSPGGVSQVCVPVTERSDGATLLNARAKQLGVAAPRYDGSGLLCAIDGFPASGCAVKTGAGFKYWSYWTGDASGWSYANVGPAGHTADAGVVEGWRFVEGVDSGSEPVPRGPSVASAICQGLSPVPSPGTTGGSLSGDGSNGGTPQGGSTGAAGGTTGGGTVGGVSQPQPGGPGDVVTLPSLPTASTTTTTLPGSSTTTAPAGRATATSDTSEAANRRAGAQARRIKAAAASQQSGGGIVGPVIVGAVVVLLVLGGIWRATRRRGRHTA